MKTKMFVLRRVFIALSFSGLLAARSVTVQLSMPKACTGFRVPAWKWVSKRTPGLVCHLRFRSSAAKLLVDAAGGTLVKGETDSIQKYELSFQTGKAEEVSDDIWNRATPLSFHHGRLFGDYPGEEELRRSNRLWKPTGSNHFGVESASENRKFYVAYSYDGIRSYPDGPFMPGRTILRGTYYVDFFEVPSGRKILAVTGRFRGVDPMAFALPDPWLDSKYFVMSLDDDASRQEYLPSRRFLVCGPDIWAGHSDTP